jgi:hypothetical protein
MASKSFKTVPTPPRQPTNEQIDAFVNKAAAPTPPPTNEPTARLSLDIPAELHSRFKSACARSRLKMTAELEGKR